VGIKIGNFPNLTATDSDRPIKDNIQDADTPELLIAPVSSTYAIGAASNIHQMTRRFNIRLATTDQVTHNKLFPVQWALFTALARIHRLNPDLGLDFVLKLTVIDDQSALTDLGDGQRSTRGWVSLLSIDVAMQFENDDLEIQFDT